jgi:hypothetical protein
MVVTQRQAARDACGDLSAPGHGLCPRALEGDRDVGEASVLAPGAMTARRSPAANVISLAKVKLAVLADAAKVIVPIETPFFCRSRSA